MNHLGLIASKKLLIIQLWATVSGQHVLYGVLFIAVENMCLAIYDISRCAVWLKQLLSTVSGVTGFGYFADVLAMAPCFLAEFLTGVHIKRNVNWPHWYIIKKRLGHVFMWKVWIHQTSVRLITSERGLGRQQCHFLGWSLNTGAHGRTNLDCLAANLFLIFYIFRSQTEANCAYFFQLCTIDIFQNWSWCSSAWAERSKFAQLSFVVNRYTIL